MNKKLISFYVIIFSIFMIFSCAEKEKDTGIDESAAPSNTAVLVLSIGSVRVSHSSVWRDAEINMALHPGDEIETGDRSKCNIVIGKDSYISVKENSKLILQELTLNDNGSENTAVELKIGKGVINPKKLLKNDSFDVKTPTSVAAVRGTKFTVETNPGEVTKISVIEGKVQLKKRITVLENTETEESNSELSDMLNDKIEKESIIISENQSGEIDNTKVEELNSIVTEVIEVTKTEKLEKEQKGTKETAPLTAQLNEKLAEMNNVIESESSIQKTDQISISEKQEVSDLEAYVKENKTEIDKAVKIAEKIKLTENEKIAAPEQTNKVDDVVAPKGMKLFVQSPEKNSSIYIDGRLKGRGKAEYLVKENEKINILIKTKGYEDYAQEIAWEDKSEKTINTILIKTKLLDRVAWKIAFPGEVKGSVLEFGNKSILTSSTGRISCVNASGEIIWNNNLSGGIDSVPAVGKDRLYVGTKDGNFYSLNKSTGKILFTNQLDGALLFNTAPLITEKEIFAATSTGKVYKIDFDGNIKWMKDIYAGVYSTPVFDGYNLYLGTDSRSFIAMNAGNGKIDWQMELDSRIVSSSPVVYQNSIIACSYNGTMYIINKKKGKVRQSLELSSPILVTPVIKGHNALVATNDGNLYSVNIDTGKINWQKKFPGTVINSPSSQGNSLYLSSGNTVYDLNINNGNINWSYNLGEKIKTSVSFAGTNLIMGSENGTLFSVRKDLRDMTE